MAEQHAALLNCQVAAADPPLVLRVGRLNRINILHEERLYAGQASATARSLWGTVPAD